MKDILVDSTVAKNFCNPLGDEYKIFIKWIHAKGVLVVTQKLIAEYHRTAASSPSNTSMPALLNHLMIDGRVTHCKNSDLRKFAFSKRIRNRLRSNTLDHDNIKAIMMSVRKFALSHDKNFRHDVNSYPGYAARAEVRPNDIPYAL